MSFRLTTLLAGLAATFAVHAVEPDFAYFVDKHPSQIRHVVSCGTWHHENLHGFFRIVEAYQFAQSYLYVQWMSNYDFQTSETHAIDTAALAEINADHAEITLSEIACTSTSGTTRITAKANFSHEDKWYRMQLDLGQQPGKNTLEFVRLPSTTDKQP